MSSDLRPGRDPDRTHVPPAESPDHGPLEPVHSAQVDTAGAGGAGVADAAAEVHYCDLCGHQMLDLHCKLICERCGYKRDCSDP